MEFSTKTIKRLYYYSVTVFLTDCIIRGLPQFVLMKNGEEIKRHAGAMTIFELTEFCDECK